MPRELVEPIAVKWLELWQRDAPVFLDPANSKSDLRRAIRKQTSKLDCGRGDPIEKATKGRAGWSEDEAAVLLFLDLVAYGGYLWREAEVDLGTTIYPREIMKRNVDPPVGSDRSARLFNAVFLSISAGMITEPLFQKFTSFYQDAEECVVGALVANTTLGDGIFKTPPMSLLFAFRSGVLLRDADEFLPA